MYRYEVGTLYSPTRTSWPDAAEFNVRDGGLELRLFFGGLTSREIAAVRSGPADFALLIDGPLILFLYQFGQEILWSDCPFTIYHVPPEQRTLPQGELPPGAGYALPIFLVEGRTGILQAIRLVGLPHEFSVSLRQALLNQATTPFDARAYDATRARLYREAPSVPMLLPRVIARTHFERGQGQAPPAL